MQFQASDSVALSVKINFESGTQQRLEPFALIYFSVKSGGSDGAPQRKRMDGCTRYIVGDDSAKLIMSLSGICNSFRDAQDSIKNLKVNRESRQQGCKVESFGGRFKCERCITVSHTWTR